MSKHVSDIANNASPTDVIGGDDSVITGNPITERFKALPSSAGFVSKQNLKKAILHYLGIVFPAYTQDEINAMPETKPHYVIENSTTGELIRWNDSQWVPLGSSSGGSQDLQSVTESGATTDKEITVKSIIASGDTQTIAAPTNFTATVSADENAYYPDDSHLFYRVYAYMLINGVKIFSQTYADVTVLPTGNQNHNAITLSWDAVPGADGYRLFIKDPDYNGYNFDAGYDTPNTTVYDDAQGDNNRVYYASDNGRADTLPTVAYLTTSDFETNIKAGGNVSADGGFETISGSLITSIAAQFIKVLKEGTVNSAVRIKADSIEIFYPAADGSDINPDFPYFASINAQGMSFSAGQNGSLGINYSNIYLQNSTGSLSLAAGIVQMFSNDGFSSSMVPAGYQFASLNDAQMNAVNVAPGTMIYNSQQVAFFGRTAFGTWQKVGGIGNQIYLTDDSVPTLLFRSTITAGGWNIELLNKPDLSVFRQLSVSATTISLFDASIGYLLSMGANFITFSHPAKDGNPNLVIDIRLPTAPAPDGSNHSGVFVLPIIDGPKTAAIAIGEVQADIYGKIPASIANIGGSIVGGSGGVNKYLKFTEGTQDYWIGPLATSQPE